MKIKRFKLVKIIRTNDKDMTYKRIIVLSRQRMFKCFTQT